MLGMAREAKWHVVVRLATLGWLGRSREVREL